METNLIGLCGFKGSGKDTTGICLQKHGFKKDSFAKPLKDICAILFNWDRQLLEGDTDYSRKWREEVDEWWSQKLDILNFTPRLAMQLVGTNSLRNVLSQDLWVASLERRINTKIKTVIVDCRFPNELDIVKKNGGLIICINQTMPDWYDDAKVLGDIIYQQYLGLLDKTTYLQHPIYNKLKQNNIHESEWMWLGYPIDIHINNKGTIDDLQREVDKLF